MPKAGWREKSTSHGQMKGTGKAPRVKGGGQVEMSPARKQKMMPICRKSMRIAHKLDVFELEFAFSYAHAFTSIRVPCKYCVLQFSVRI